MKRADDGEIEPWSLSLPRRHWRDFTRIGAGALVASFFIGTGDITIAATMGARFGFSLWWTYFVLGLAGWAMMDMSVRYFLRFGRTPLALFKELHPAFAFYLLATIVVTTTLGAYSQWNACAHVVSGFVPSLAPELGGFLTAALAVAVLWSGAYRRMETFFVVALIGLIVVLALAAARIDVPWGEAWTGLVPSGPREPKDAWFALIQSNAGSLINAWLILVYPYTMLEKGWYSRDVREQAALLRRARFDYGVGIAAAGVVALPIIAAAYGAAQPFGIVPRNGTEFALLLEPIAGPAARALFLTGLWIAAWTAGIGWIVCGAYAVLDIGNLEVSMRTGKFRALLVFFAVASSAMLFLRINPFDGIRVFAAFLAVVFPVIAVALVLRLSRADLGYFRWSLLRPGGIAVVVLDLFGLAVSLYVGWGLVSSYLVNRG
jgi:manganese transport protein